ncbi:bZIP transcription factor (DUF630 and DUF632) [Tasmannia lanceolata]|uniref:bZIP transcription factor (DUF630 and DUF632) n=1 Tax=Tasmannia lanceolata TaxID=3420 RepID=UPI004063464B
MGVSSSRIEDDKAQLLCRERKRLIRQALDGRCSLAAAHVSYIQSLRDTGTALRKFVEPEIPLESSLYTSTSATPEPLALTDKSLSPFSYSSLSPSQHVETAEALSPTPSPPYSGRFHVNYAKTGRTTSTTVEERPPISVTATIRSASGTPKNSVPRSVDTPAFEAPSTAPITPAWDYFDFGLFHPIESQFSFQDGRTLNPGLDDADDLRRLREEEGIPDLEEEEERKEEYLDSEEDFNEPSAESLVRSFERRNDVFDSHSINTTPSLQSFRSIDKNMRLLNGEKGIAKDDMDEADERDTPDLTPLKTTPVVTAPTNEKTGPGKVPSSENRLAPKDFLSSIKEIEYLFLKASEAGKEVPRMLEANKVNHRPIFSETQVRRSNTSIFLRACLVCFEDPEHVPQEPTTNAIRYLTWHRSASSRSSSSRNPLGSTTKDGVADSSDILFDSFCMNSGSHASTLDRLYAWERKLYDEVKASGIIRREYDMKCKLLRHQDSKGEHSYKIDKTRAVVKDLHSRIRVSIHRIDSISKRIEVLRDTELQPQLMELIEGLSRMWEIMLEIHRLQFNIISIAYYSESSKVSIQSESHHQATILLEYNLNSLCSSFTKWIGAQKSYLQAINGWLHKCVFPLQQKTSRRKSMEFSARGVLAPPIFVTCTDWLSRLEALPYKEVADSIKGLAAVTTRFLPQQEKTHRKNLSSTFSMSRKATDVQRNEAPIDWNSGFEGLQSSLVVLFDQLNKFADSSVNMYVNLDKSIKEFQTSYDGTAVRKKM